MSVAPHSGIIDFGTFTPPNSPLNGIQGEVPAPLLAEVGYILSTNGWVAAGAYVTSVGAASPITSTGGATPIIGIPVATNLVNGYLASVDWTTFNAKQTAFGSQTANNVYAAPNGLAGVPSFRALVAGDVPTLNQNTTGTASNVTGVVALANGGTGASTAANARTALQLGTAAELNAGAANGVASLDSAGTVPITQLPAAVVGAVNYQGTWNASTNTPTLTSSVGEKGYYYVVSVAGTTNLNGTTDWKIGDWAIYSGTEWQKIDNTDAVQSVNGYTGAVVLTYTDVGAQVAGTYVTSVAGTAPVVSSGGTTPSISMPAATTSVSGFLASADWNTFNSKQPAGTYVNSVAGTAGRITSSGGSAPVIDLASGIVTPSSAGSSALIPVVTVDTYGRVTSLTTAANPQGTVTSVTGTTPIVSSGGATPAISIPAATNLVNGFLTSTDWNTFNSKGTVTSVAALTLGTTGTDLSSTVATGTTTPVITLQVPTASATNRGALSATDWATFNSKQPAGTYITSVAATSPVTSSGGTTPTIAIPAATTSVNGYLLATDWTTFNAKQPALGFTPVNKAGDTMTGQLNLVAGTATVAPLDFATGVNLTTAVGGCMEFDGTVPYFSVAASTRGAIPSEQWVVLTGTNTLTSQTAVQPIFDGGGGPTNGAVTLPVGTYQFECQFALTGMSATAGSFGFGLAGAATKTFFYQSTSSKLGISLSTAMTTNQVFGTAAITALQTASVGTVGTALIKGIVRVTVAGTIIPQVSLTVASAAVIQAGSFFRVSPIGSATVATLGNWS